MKHLKTFLLVAFVAASAIELGAQAKSTTDTQNVPVDFQVAGPNSLPGGSPTASHLAVALDLVELPVGHTTLIPETGSSAMLLATGVLGAVAWLRRRSR